MIDKEFLHSLPIFLKQPSMVEPDTKRQSELQVFIKNFLEQIFHLGRGEGGGQREERRKERRERREEKEREEERGKGGGGKDTSREEGGEGCEKESREEGKTETEIRRKGCM